MTTHTLTLTTLQVKAVEYAVYLSLNRRNILLKEEQILLPIRDILREVLAEERAIKAKETVDHEE